MKTPQLPAACRATGCLSDLPATHRACINSVVMQGGMGGRGEMGTGSNTWPDSYGSCEVSGARDAVLVVTWLSNH